MRKKHGSLVQEPRGKKTANYFYHIKGLFLPILKKMWCLLLIVCSLVSSTDGQQSVVDYMLLVPAEIHYPSTETACVDISGVTEKQRLTVALHHGVKDITLLQQEVSEPTLFKCVQFQAPSPEFGMEEVLSVHLSLVGPNSHMTDSKYILVRSVGPMTLIQTDKPMYKRGETVNFRMLTIDRDFLAVNDSCPLLEIQDPNKNRIAQWLNVTPQKGIIDLSFSLDSQAKVGAYTIRSLHSQQDFHVSEYVLPEFEVIVTLPSVILITMPTFPLKICGRYTFGKGVQGEIKVTLCREAVCYYWRSCSQDLCTEYAGRTDRNGCFEVEVQTETYDLTSYYYKMTFDVEAFLTEDGTGKQMKGVGSSRISAMIAKVTFEETDPSDFYYKPNLRYKGRLRLESADGRPMKSQTVYLTEEYDEVVKEHVYETDENGGATFTLQTTAWNGRTIHLTASYIKNKPERQFGVLNPYYLDAERTLSPFTSATNSFIKVQPLDYVLLTGQKHPIEIDYIIRGSELSSDESTVDLHYVVMSRGTIVLNGEKKISVTTNSVTIGTMELLLPVTATLAPTAHILAYVLLGNRRIIADTKQFQVCKCFNNKVSLAFSEEVVSPGSQTTLHVNAQPGSLCSVRSVDEGVLLLRPESDISSDTVYGLLAQRRRRGYPYRVREDNPICWKSYHGYPQNRRKRSNDWPVQSTSLGPDVFTLIRQIGLKSVTNTQVRRPAPCLRGPPVAALSGFGERYQEPLTVAEPYNAKDYSDDGYGDLQIEEESIPVSEMNRRIRDRFPETLLWEMISVGASGQADIMVPVPDSITRWNAMAFCMGDEGLGIARPASVRSFQPFFMSLALPYSVVRGETFVLTASIFNYLSKPMMVKANLKNNPDLKIKDCPTCVSLQCLYPEGSKVVSWEAQAMRVGSSEIVVSMEAIDTEDLFGGERPIIPENGTSDAVLKTLTIKSEGIRVEKSHNAILCGGADHSSETTSITLPPGVVPNSAYAAFSVVGDLVGAALQGSEDLLNLPYGCGEQNMARLVPNIYVMDYLESAHQLTEEVRERGLKYISQGCQRQVDFHRPDGSFSAFGKRDPDGNTWLTAFVMKTFHEASRYTFVDKKFIDETRKWLKEKQLPSGCFQNRGKLFKTSLKGGVNDDISLSAYVTNAFLEVGSSLKDESVQRALQCLRSSRPLVDSLYTKALLAYTFTLSRDYEIRAMLLQELHEEALTIGGETFWPANPRDLSKDSSWSEPNSDEVELAAYVALAHLSLDSPTENDISEASSIAKWIAQQQNPHGGYANTQDTVMGFQALTKFSKITYTRHEGLEVILGTDDEDSLHQFYVVEENRFLLQTKPLSKVPGTYSVQAKGKGCAFIQTTVTYNIYNATTRTAFDIEMNVTREREEDQTKAVLTYTISVRYTGPRSASNMALLQVELPSGFIANAKSLTKMKKGLVMKTETEDNHLNIYISELRGDPETISFSAEEQFTVQNHKPRMVKVLDYYETGEEAIIMYEVPAL